jgi:hypothetical protein
MKATRWMLAGLLLLGALAVPCQAILFTCDDICDCNVSCALSCRGGNGIQTTCGNFGTCIGKCTAAAAPAASSQICSAASQTSPQPDFMQAPPAQP